ncbi:hypothetical protein FGLOB1_3723 [Fusarium globosum]|uniref:Uncharacterized protein n=1 Tax=Fusarium globosum TaxID=78864 RepID=A0A8H6DDS6_9HYPO|nr:hypothetical protein FGLOB1_3723 [Fusarium globosum]
MLLHYCTQSFWPGFEIGSAAFHIPPFALDYNTLVAQGPALVHACLWQAAVNLAFKRNSRVTDKQSILHYNQAIAHISRDITKPVAQIPEQTLYAILSLCGPEMSPDDGNGIAKKAFDPPLAELSWIHVFGSRLLIDSHARALMNLVDLKGGIHNVKYAGFQASFNYMDLVRATQMLVKPHLPVSQLYGRVKETRERAKFFGYASDFSIHSPIDEGSHIIDRLNVLGLSVDIREVIYDMRIWVKVIEAYHHNTLTNPDLSLLAAHRDLIQQRLLATLPDGYDGKKLEQIDTPSTTTADHWINEIIQTALLIFSLGVTCPISYAPPYHHAAQRLQAQLILYKDRATHLGLSDLLIWLGMLGILCTEQVGSQLREWFVGFLGLVEQKHGLAGDIRDWDMVKKESLVPILWSSVACDATAGRAWRDVKDVADEMSWNWVNTCDEGDEQMGEYSYLRKKVVLVTGGSKGIGKAVVERVVADGANVVINYSSDNKPAEELVSKIGSERALAFKADVSNISEIENLVQATVEKFGKIDCVMANAACAPMNDLDSTTEEDFDKAFNLNVKGPYFLVQKAVKHMPRDGRVILVSSGVLHQSQVAPRYLLYASSKGSVEQMTRILAKDLGPKGITVNAIAPGPTATEMFFQGKSQELIDTIAGFSPLGRLGKPEEIAALAAFLAGPTSSWVSGQVIGANGGAFV